MNNLNFCGIYEDLMMDAINEGSGSEAPILLLEEEFDHEIESMITRKAPDISDFKANEILKELEDLQKHVKAFNEVQERYLDRLERHYERIEKERDGE
jgi:hypothetical protein